MNRIAADYTQALMHFAETEDESRLLEIAALARRCIQNNIPPESVAEFHQMALAHLAQEAPLLSFHDSIEKTTPPLLELFMAYGLAFRQQMELHYASLLADRMRESQKMEAIGTLAAGISHDFNNILGVVIGYAEMLLDDQPADSFEARSLKTVLDAAQRGQDLVERMLLFARQERLSAQSIDIVHELKEALVLLRSALPSTVSIESPLPDEPIVVTVDRTHLTQIVLNLGANAAHAMKNRGTLSLHLTRTLIPLTEKEAVCLSVQDTGSGIPYEIQKRIFDPFFTTKEVGEGTGLGLSVVHGIVTGYGGLIEVESQMGQGTTFKLYFPLVPPPRLILEEKT